jgi:hypothetical protein
MKRLPSKRQAVKGRPNGEPPKAAGDTVPHDGNLSEKPNVSRCHHNDTGAVEQVEISKLRVHPAIVDFPTLSEGSFTEANGTRKYLGDFDRLKADIKAKDGRILVPLLADVENRIVDGRHRFRIAKELDLSTVPVVRVNGDAIEIALASALTKRQVTKSGIALILFEHHPDLQMGGRERSKSALQGESADVTFASLAQRYGIPRQYFSGLAAMAEEFSDKQWSEARDLILFQEYSIAQAYKGVKGQTATKGKKRNDPKWERLLHESMVVELPERLKCWKQLPEENRRKHCEAVRGTVKRWPREYARWLRDTLQEFFPGGN